MADLQQCGDPERQYVARMPIFFVVKGYGVVIAIKEDQEVGLDFLRANSNGGEQDL
jgi:hypothetical protein